MRKKSKEFENVEIEDFPPITPEQVFDEFPPGQHLAKRWPVLSAERPPEFDGKNWDIVVDGLVEDPITWSWTEFNELPKTTKTVDIHCVTSWSLLGQEFSGVAFNDIVDRVKPLPNAKYVTFEAESGYDSAIPLQEGYLLEDDVLLAYEHEGKPLPKDHGGPLRLVIPQLYFWKSVKWVQKITFKKEWERGFWEKRGYHILGRPELEERYSSQERPKRRDHKIE